MFSQDKNERLGARPVSSLTRDESRRLMHTADRLTDTPWLLDGSGRLIPSSVCDCEYLEQAFEGDQSFFMRTIGGLNVAEMNQRLIENPRKRLSDSEFYKYSAELSLRWFKTELSCLSINSKVRLIPYINRTMRTTVPQLARTFGLSRDEIARILGKVPARNGMRVVKVEK